MKIDRNGRENWLRFYDRRIYVVLLRCFYCYVYLLRYTIFVLIHQISLVSKIPLTEPKISSIQQKNIATFNKFQVFIRFNQKMELSQWNTLWIHQNDFVKWTTFFLWVWKDYADVGITTTIITSEFNYLCIFKIQNMSLTLL